MSVEVKAFARGDAVVLDDVPLGMCIAEGGVPEVSPTGDLQAAQKQTLVLGIPVKRYMLWINATYTHNCG
jgi:hypothetical protein